MRSDADSSAPSALESQQQRNAIEAFRSTAHPAEQPLALVLGQAILGPLSWILLPIMVLAVVAALERANVGAYVFVGLPLAVVAATGLAVYRLQGQSAVLYVAGSLAAVCTVWDVLKGNDPRWAPVLDVRVAEDTVFATLNDSTHEFNRSDWAEYPNLVASLVYARHSYVLEMPE